MAHAWTRLEFAVMLALAVVASACGGSAGSQATPQPMTPSLAPAPTAPAATAPAPSVLPVVLPSPESPSDAGMQAAVDAATRDVANRLGLASLSDIHVQHVQAQQWPDSSLGCPSPDVMYSQVVTPGYVLIISAAGKQLEYHADSRGTIVFCHDV